MKWLLKFDNAVVDFTKKHNDRQIFDEHERNF